MEPIRVCVCCEQPRSLHGPGPGTSQLHSRTMWHWQGYSLGCPPAGASGDTSLEWLQRLSLGWLSPSLPLPEKGIWGQGWGWECQLDPSMAGRALELPLTWRAWRMGWVKVMSVAQKLRGKHEFIPEAWDVVSRTPRNILLSHLMINFHFRFPFIPCGWFHSHLYLVSVMSVT